MTIVVASSVQEQEAFVQKYVRIHHVREKLMCITDEVRERPETRTPGRYTDWHSQSLSCKNAGSIS